MHSYTLLVIESPTIARIIDAFRIPSLEVIPTYGYCWNPVFDPETGNMKMKADPGRLDIRKRLSTKIPWAKRVIIATDSDSAGEFIAWSIWKHYRSRNNLYRNYLNALSYSGIEELVASATLITELNPETVEKKRQIHHIIEKHLEPAFGRYAWIKMLLIQLFSTSVSVDSFRGSGSDKEIYFFSEKPIPVHFNETLRIHSTRKRKPFKVPDPFNTAELLCEGRSLFTSYTEVQDTLNRLFSEIPGTMEGAVISYPRTERRGFYRGTMEAFYREWLLKKPAESFRPLSLWPVIDRNNPHEALHPLSLEVKPGDVRPFVRKQAYDLYTKIYNRTIKSLQAPEPIPYTGYTVSGTGRYEERINLYTDYDGHLEQEYILHPIVRIDFVLDRLSCLGVLKPSSYGSVTDSLIEDKWLSVGIDSGEATPGKCLKGWLHRREVVETVEECTCLVENQPWNKVSCSQLLSLLQRITSYL